MVRMGAADANTSFIHLQSTSATILSIRFPSCPSVGSGGLLGSFLENPLGGLLSAAGAGLTGGAAGALGPLFNPLDLSFRQVSHLAVQFQT